MAVPKRRNADQVLLMVAFARVDALALAVAMGTVCAIGLFLLSAVLLIKGAPPGVPVGTHLGLLGAYWPGYTITWAGSLIGAVYAGASGALIGFVWAVLWNLTHYLYIILVVVRAHWWRMMAD